MADMATVLSNILPRRGGSEIARLGMDLKAGALTPSEYVDRRSTLSASMDLPRHPDAATCPKCGGQGYVGEGDTERFCETCNSLGYTMPEKEPVCGLCKGAEFVSSKFTHQAVPCPLCEGSTTLKIRDVDIWRVMHQADVPQKYRQFSLDSYLDQPNLADEQSAAGLLVGAWAENPFVFNEQNGVSSIVLSGGVGVGKTGLAVAAIGKAATWAERPRFVSWLRLQSRIMASYGPNVGGSRYEMIEQYAKADVLVLDDFGTSGTPASDHAIALAEEMIEARATGGHATLITTNLTQGQLEVEFGARVASRIAAMCKWIDVQGEDARREVAA